MEATDRRVLKFEGCRFGNQDGILLNGSLISVAETLPFLQEFARIYEINERAIELLTSGRVDEALAVLRLEEE